MHYRQLGDSGLTVSVLGLGCNNLGRRLDLAGTRELVDAALATGVTLFDVADIYGGHDGTAERLLGAALAGHRDQVVVATKFGMDMAGHTGPEWQARGSRGYVRRAIEGSLRRLGTDYVDLYQYHEPDGRTPIEETLAVLDELVREGKVRYVGSSNFAGWQVVDADWTARTAGTARFVSAQNAYNLLEREAERELVPACEHLGIGLLPFYPLANGLLTGKYRRGEAAPAGTRLAEPGKAHLLHGPTFDRLDALAAYAAKRELSMLEVAIGGLAARPGVASVIAGARTPEQLRANAAAVAWVPGADDLAELEETLISGEED